MPGAVGACRTSDQTHERSPLFNRRGVGAWLIGVAGSVDLACCYACQTDARPFGAPDRAISVPHGNRCAAEARPGRNNCCSEKQEGAHSRCLTPVAG